MGAEDTHDSDAAGNDDNDSADDQESVTEDDADTSQNTDADDDGSDKEPSKDGDKDKGKGDSDKSTDTADDDDADDDDDDGKEPEIRRPKTNAEWAAKRVADKAKQKAEKSGKKDAKEDDSGTADDDDDAPTVEKRLEAIEKHAADQEVEASIATFVKDNPDFAPFAKKAERYAKHPSRANVPIKSIFYEVAGDKLMQIGAKRAQSANAKAKSTRTGGGNSAGNEGGKSYKDMSQDEFAKELEGVKMRR